MKTFKLLLSIFILSSGVISFAACGPDWCCSRPRLCGRGSEISKWQAEEKSCLDQAAYSVDGRVLNSPLGYPLSIINRSSGLEAAMVSWSNGVCFAKYGPGYFGN